MSGAGWTFRAPSFAVLSLVVMVSGSSAACTSSNSLQRDIGQAWSPACSPPSSLPSQLRITVTPKGPIVAANDNEVELTCTLDTSDDNGIPWLENVNFSWELSGALAPAGHQYHSLANASVLVFNMSVLTEGSYRCIAAYSDPDYPITEMSSEVLVELPRMDGWIDVAMPVPLHETAIQSPTNRLVSQGGSTILECHPRTNSPSLNATVTWLKDNVTISMPDPSHRWLDVWTLLVQNFTLPSVGEDKRVRYECHVSGRLPGNQTSVEVMRSFDVMLAEGPEASTPILPEDRTVIVGDNVTFYCILASKSPLTSVVSWLKDGRPLDYAGLSVGGGFGPISEVLALQNVGTSSSGNYSCVGYGGATHNATLKVIAPPTTARIYLETSGDDIIFGNDIIRTGSGGVNLTCLAITNDLNSQFDLSYQWYYNGSSVSSTGSVSGLTAYGNSLRVGGNARGTVQCISSNRAGSISVSMNLLSKPRPPTDLVYGHKTNNNRVVFGLGFSPDPTYSGASRLNELLTYKVRTQVYTAPDPFYMEYNCSQSYATGERRAMDLPVEDYVTHRNGYEVHIAVTAIYRGMESRYVSFLEDISGSCLIPVNIPVINESFLDDSVIRGHLSGHGLWNITLSWNEPQQKITGFFIWSVLNVQCMDLPPKTERFDSDQSTYELTNVPSCDSCSWTVTYHNGNEHLNDTINFTANASVPVLAPTLQEVRRVGNNGTTARVRFTIPQQRCDPTAVILTFSDPHTTRNTTPLSLARCSTPSPSSPSEYTCDVELERGLCWADYNISVAYRNDAEGYTNHSNIVALPQLKDSDLRFSDLSVGSGGISSNTVTLHYELGRGLTCLLKTAPPSSNTIAKICTRQAGGPDSRCYMRDEDSCSDFALPFDYRTFESFNGTWDSPHLSGDTQYTFTAFVSHGNLVNCMSVSVRTLEGVPSGMPKNVSFTVSRDSNISNSLLLTWLPPPQEEWNGNISYYRILFWDSENPSGSSSREVNSTSLRYSEEYDRSRHYSYAIAACTRQGCGPSYNHTNVQATTQRESSKDILAIEIALPALALVIIIVIMIVVIIVVKRPKLWKTRNNFRCTESTEELFRQVDNVENGDGDPIINIAGRRNASDTQSESTEYNCLDKERPYYRETMKRFLADGSPGEERLIRNGDGGKDEAASLPDNLQREPEERVAELAKPGSKGRKRRKKRQHKMEGGDSSPLITPSSDVLPSLNVVGGDDTPTHPEVDAAFAPSSDERVPSLSPHTPAGRAALPSSLAGTGSQQQQPTVSSPVHSSQGNASRAGFESRTIHTRRPDLSPARDYGATVSQSLTKPSPLGVALSPMNPAATPTPLNRVSSHSPLTSATPSSSLISATSSVTPFAPLGPGFSVTSWPNPPPSTAHQTLHPTTAAFSTAPSYVPNSRPPNLSGSNDGYVSEAKPQPLGLGGTEQTPRPSTLGTRSATRPLTPGHSRAGGPELSSGFPGWNAGPISPPTTFQQPWSRTLDASSDQMPTPTPHHYEFPHSLQESPLRSLSSSGSNASDDTPMASFPKSRRLDGMNSSVFPSDIHSSSPLSRNSSGYICSSPSGSTPLAAQQLDSSSGYAICSGSLQHGSSTGYIQSTGPQHSSSSGFTSGTPSADLQDMQLDTLDVSGKFPCRKLSPSMSLPGFQSPGVSPTSQEYEMTPIQEVVAGLGDVLCKEGAQGYNEHCLDDATLTLRKQEKGEGPEVAADADNKSDTSSETSGSVFTPFEAPAGKLFDQNRGNVTSRSSYGSEDAAMIGRPLSPQSRRESDFSEGYQSMAPTPAPAQGTETKFSFPEEPYIKTESFDGSNGGRNCDDSDYMNVSSDMGKVEFSFNAGTTN